MARFEEVPVEKYTGIVDSLRANGIVSSLYIGTKKFGKQLDYAIKGKYTHVVIIGGNELETGIAKIKNLSTHEETECPLDKIGEYFN